MGVSNFDEISTKISDLKCCVIIPTYNNEKTLKKVIDSVLNYTIDIIIVNDGSTDQTPEILKEYTSRLQIITFSKNKGKGLALRKGFKRAYQEGFIFAITIDSDGQHFANDIPVFIAELEKCKPVLLIGSRNMNHKSVPGGSSFGNKFSNFWYWVETGKKLIDTQSGFRLYPLKTMHEIKFYTTKFEFEIESIVKISWREILVKNVPIKVLYNDSRVSHFRPYKDFARISVLNIWLVFVAFLYIKPRDLFLRIKKKGFKQFFVENIMRSSDSPKKKALSIALGAFIACSPFWGFHAVLALALAVPLKLNKTISAIFSSMSIPPVIPFIIYGSFKMGSWALGTEEINIDFENIMANTKLFGNVKEYLIGSFILGFISALTFGSIGYILLKLTNKNSG